MECFRCYDMNVIDPVVLESIKGILSECYDWITSDHEPLNEMGVSLVERLNHHIILLEAMPDE